MAIKDKIKKATHALKKDEPQQEAAPAPVAATSQTKSTSTSAPAPSKTTAAPPTSITIPSAKSSNGTNGNGAGPKTPKTPQDEAIAFFSSGADGQPVQVHELWLEDDGGPGDNKSVSTRSNL
jgi:hypothetical protein